MTAAVKTKTSVQGDVLKMEQHQGYCRESGLFKNTSGSTISGSILGQPLVKSGAYWVPVLTTGEATQTGLCLYQQLLDGLVNNGVLDVKIPVLVRGPAIVMKDELPILDVEGAVLSRDAQETALLALDPPVICVDAPTVSEIQTT